MQKEKQRLYAEGEAKEQGEEYVSGQSPSYTTRHGVRR